MFTVRLLLIRRSIDSKVTGLWPLMSYWCSYLWFVAHWGCLLGGLRHAIERVLWFDLYDTYDVYLNIVYIFHPKASSLSGNVISAEKATTFSWLQSIQLRLSLFEGIAVTKWQSHVNDLGSLSRAAVVIQLAEQSFPIPEDPGSNRAYWKFAFC